MSWKSLSRSNSREHVTVYVLATLSNLLLSIPEYLAVRLAVVSNIPVKGSTGGFISNYGPGLGLALDFLWALLIYQTLLLILLLAIASASLVQKGWRWLYIFGAMMMCGFVGYWIGTKFLQSLSWVSLLQNSGINGSALYSDLFWFALGAATSYVGMILILRRSYDKLLAIKGSLTTVGIGV